MLCSELLKSDWNANYVIDVEQSACSESCSYNKNINMKVLHVMSEKLTADKIRPCGHLFKKHAFFCFLFFLYGTIGRSVSIQEKCNGGRAVSDSLLKAKYAIFGEQS